MDERSANDRVHRCERGETAVVRCTPGGAEVLESGNARVVVLTEVLQSGSVRGAGVVNRTGRGHPKEHSRPSVQNSSLEAVTAGRYDSCTPDREARLKSVLGAAKGLPTGLGEGKSSKVFHASWTRVESVP